MPNDELQNLKIALKKIEEGASHKPLVDTSGYLIQEIRDELAGIINIPASSIELEIPPEHISGDFAFSVFRITEGEEPTKIANEIVFKLNQSSGKYFSRAEQAGAFVNIFLNQGLVYPGVLNTIKKLGSAYGTTDVNKEKLAWVEYSQPNIAKPFGVGHLRSTIIGESLSRIYEATGYDVIRHNYLGDWGTQFGKLIYAYKNWYQGENPSVKELKDLYVEFHERAEKNPKIEDEAREISKKLEDGDRELTEIWNKFRTLSIDEFRRTYDRLGIRFDTWLGESFFNDKMQEVIEDAKKAELAKRGEEDALVVDLGEGISSFVLQRGDGGGLYITRDLAALKFRSEISKADRLIYVVDQRQSLHFKQLFGLASRLGYLKSEAKHIPFGLLLSGGEAMSTRKGTLVELEDLIEQSVQKAKEIIRTKSFDLDESEVGGIAETIGVAAVIYNDLRQSRVKNITFDWNRMLDFESGSAAYLQYTYARIQSVLRKLGISKISDSCFKEKIEFEVVRKLMLFPAVILNAQKLDSPHIVATYLEELAHLANTFYGAVSIAGTEDVNLKRSRLLLVQSVGQIIKNGLRLLNIQTVEKM